MATEPAYSRAEFMVAAAARQIGDGEVVFVGMRLPLIAFVAAKQTHAPNAVGLFECGLVRDVPALELLYTMGDPPNVLGASWATRLVNVMGLLAQGGVDLGFLGAAEIDRHGNLNTSYIGPFEGSFERPFERPKVKLPGSGGAADIACLSKRFVVLMNHQKRRLVERVSYVTSPGHGSGGAWRRQVGLPGGGPAAVITTLGVLGFEEGEMILQSVHPQVSVEDVRAETGWDLRVSPDLGETPPPTSAELEAIRAYDPQGFWTRAEA